MDTGDPIAEIVRTADRDRWLADLTAPPEARPHLFALHALAAEIARIPGLVSDPTLGEIRLQWWHDALHGDPSGHPVAEAAKAAIARFSLPLSAFDRLIEARVFDLYNDPMPDLATFEGYAGDTASGLVQLAAIVLAGGRDPGTAEAAGHAGVALAIAGRLRSLGRDAAERRFFLPADRAATAGLGLGGLFAGQATPELRAFLAGMCAVARRHLGSARAALAGADRAVLPAFLPLALVEAELKRMEKAADPLRDAGGLSPFRRQWLIWRAARRGRV